MLIRSRSRSFPAPTVSNTTFARDRKEVLFVFFCFFVVRGMYTIIETDAIALNDVGVLDACENKHLLPQALELQKRATKGGRKKVDRHPGREGRRERERGKLVSGRGKAKTKDGKKTKEDHAFGRNSDRGQLLFGLRAHALTTGDGGRGSHELRDLIT
eukprot:1234766-Rhodomonas_salina.2